MTTGKQYNPLSVTIKFHESRRASWAWQGNKIQGTEFIYHVRDKNFDRLNEWSFSVKAPQKPGQIVVQPQSVPGKKAFAELQRRSITLQRATKQPSESTYYCKIHLADPSMGKNWRGTTLGDRDRLPTWFKYFRQRIRLKKTVSTTAGTDSNNQVVLISKEDHERMIRLYFAMRVWVLQENFILE